MTVLAAFLIAVLFTMLLGGVWIGSAVVARHRAQAAADLAALAAASRVPAGPAAACAQAQSVARAMRAAIGRCDIEHLDVVVTVMVPTGISLGGAAGATARAGPDNE